MELFKVDLTLDIPDPVIKIHEHLPIYPSYSVVVGSGGSGKTLMLVSLFEKIKKVFKGRLVVFTNSHVNTLIESVERLNGVIHQSIYNSKGEDIIEKILSFQKKLKEQKQKLKPILIVLDDFIDNDIMNKRRSSLTKLFTMGRHYNVSVIVTSQSFKLLPSSVRKLSHYYFLYGTGNNTERKTIANELCGMLSENDFLDLFDDITSNKYSFMLIDTNKSRILKNMNEVVYKR